MPLNLSKPKRNTLLAIRQELLINRHYIVDLLNVTVENNNNTRNSHTNLDFRHYREIQEDIDFIENLLK